MSNGRTICGQLCGVVLQMPRFVIFYFLYSAIYHDSFIISSFNVCSVHSLRRPSTLNQIWATFYLSRSTAVTTLYDSQALARLGHTLL
jgi:hypothetical protein